MNSQLPPGPRMPASVQTFAIWIRPTAFLERARERYGPRFTLRMIGYPPLVMLGTPEEIRQLFLTPPDVVHPGEGGRLLEPLIGRHSVGVLDGDAHLEQRKLMLPAFHGERLALLADQMAELAQREIAGWPRERSLELHALMQRLTLEVILATIFGERESARLDMLRATVIQILGISKSPFALLPLPRGVFARFPTVARFLGLVAALDRLIFQIIAERREDGSEMLKDDVLAMLLEARHEDGSPMSAQELRDELVTLLFAAQDTTSAQLAWTCELLARTPRVQRRLCEELRDDADENYLTAVIHEVMRLKPVVPYAQVGIVKEPVKIGDIQYQPGVALVANAHQLHRDPTIYPQPNVFLPERFLERPPGTYTWIPFGGGRRRCLGSSYALLEMKIVLRALLERYELSPLGGRWEATHRHSLTIVPARGCKVILRDRRSSLPRTQGPNLRDRHSSLPPTQSPSMRERDPPSPRTQSASSGELR